VHAKKTTGEPDPKPAVYARAIERRTPPAGIQRTQFAESQPESIVVPQFAAPVAGSRRVQAFPRSGVPIQATYFQNPRNPSEQIAVVTGGVQIRIDGLSVPLPTGDLVGQTIDISADRVVIWTPSNIRAYLEGDGNEAENMPLELYLEGDIIFREGDRIVYAQAMYYNVPQRIGTILNAEVLTPVPNYAGLMRLRADVLRQVGKDRFTAEGASVTTSRLAMPSYEFRAGSLVVQDLQQPRVNPLTRLPEIDPQTGQPINDHLQLITSNNNVVFLEGVPIFYWPTLATDLEKPTYYLRSVEYGHDSIFGHTLETEWDVYQLLGWRNPPPNTDWELSLDYLSDRGPAAGTRFSYDRDIFFNQPGPTYGLLDAWFVHDEGLDTLGIDRANMTPEEELRGRFLLRHREQLPNYWQVTGQVGYITDRNFLEQYFEQEWDEQPDALTGVELKRTVDNTSLAISVYPRINEFFLQTEDLPKVDHFWLGQSLFTDRLTWYEHTTLGYLRQNPATAPLDPQDLATFAPLPYEATVQGERVATRHALELPLDLGPGKVVPFVLGEAAHWGEDLAGDDLQRVYGTAGIRTSLPIWSVDPAIESMLFNLHGLSHKMIFEAGFAYTDASQDVTQLPLYDEIDDDNIQAFRRRLAFQDFGGPPPVPPEFDERFYAIRRGLHENVTGPTEIADDLEVFRLGLRQRWQTKRGPPDNRRIIDWITLDTHAEIFPDDEQNFGENLGLVDYDFRWHVGDRFSLLSTGAADFFSQGQKMFTAGAFLSRPPRGNVFLGFRSLEGPISANVLLASYSYRMSPKWVSSLGISYDLTNEGAMGETFTLTRIGESFLFSVGMNADQGRDNVGFSVAMEPRFFPRTSFGRRTGIALAPAGAFVIE
jgi:hypothetical protein